MATRALRRPIRRLRWLIVGMLFLATVISYVDRQALSVNAPVIRAHLGLSNIQYSYLVTSFLVAYTIGQTLAGWLEPRAQIGLARVVVVGQHRVDEREVPAAVRIR